MSESPSNASSGELPVDTDALAKARRAGFQKVRGEQDVIKPTRIEGVQKIIDGVKVPPSELQDCCAVGDDVEFYCTGTLIAPTLVVTARHCTGATRVFFGTNIANLGAGQVISVARKHSHPSQDLQVLELASAPAGIAPRHIAQGGEVSGNTCILAGFGATEITGKFGYGEKRKLEKMPIVSLLCQGAGERGQFGCKPGAEMVAGQRGLVKDSCSGDSGGPLYIDQSDGSKALLGVTSRGVRNSSSECGDGGIYVRVDQFVDWIKQETGVSIPGPSL
jgi:endonuclease G